MRPTLLKIILFWFGKYAIFYVGMMFKSGNYAFVQINDFNSREDLYYYLLLFLPLPVLCAAIFTWPMFILLHLNSKVKAFITLIAVVLIEFALYTYIASPSNLVNGLINAVITLGAFFLVFRQRVLQH